MITNDVSSHDTNQKVKNILVNREDLKFQLTNRNEDDKQETRMINRKSIRFLVQEPVSCIRWFIVTKRVIKDKIKVVRQYRSRGS